jgi:hypothetical protein
MNNPILLARLAILPFTIFEWGVMLWCHHVLLANPRALRKRAIFVFASPVAIIAVIVMQIGIFNLISSSDATEDPFVEGVLIVQHIVLIALSVRAATRLRAEKSRPRDA